MNPTLYEINTRVWRHRFGANTRLLDIPLDYWKQLANLGVDFVWLMGVWQTGPNVHQYALAPDLQAEYSRVLPDWSEADVIGSPYAIDRYQLHADLGKAGDLKKLKARLNKLGLRLMLDFVPNHFHAETSLLIERPDLFLEVDSDLATKDPSTFYHPPTLPTRAFAHGKDPYFTAWQDTIQVNYTKATTRTYMGELLLELAGQCDGLRCDMAMLLLPHVIQQTWGKVLGDNQQEMADFWPVSIQNVKDKYPDFCFLAEVYWDLEWTLQNQGFDYTYDKRLLDRLHQPIPAKIKHHVQAELDFQKASVRFLENHDEERSRSFLSPDQAQAAALIAYTIPGMRFFYQGQWEGRRLCLPVQLGREPEELIYSSRRLSLQANTSLGQLPGLEVVDANMAVFYEALLQLLRQAALKQGQWTLVELEDTNLLAWQWQWQTDTYLVIVNYQPASTSIQLPVANGQWQHFGTYQPASQHQQLLAFGYLILVGKVE